MISLNTIISQSFYDKVNTAIYDMAITETVEEITEQTMLECMNECPVRTGNLRDSHYTEIDEKTGRIGNTAEYWKYVVYGTSRMSANNYPSRAWNTMKSTNGPSTIFKNKLKENGLDIK